MFAVLELSKTQYFLVYNMFSFVVATMGAAFLYFLLTRRDVSPHHRLAVTMSTLICAIACYHYFRIFGNWKDAFTVKAGVYSQTGEFNEGYRYADWMLTVPLLLSELVLVLKLAKVESRKLITQLVLAAILMIGTGYPGEVATASSSRMVWGIISTIPFLFILYVLFVRIGKSLSGQPAGTKTLFDALRYIIIATWGVYPIAYLFGQPGGFAGLNESTSQVVRQVGYSLADVLAKPAYGLIIIAIAVIKSREERYVVA
jgi:bacteriorhodopsin